MNFPIVWINEELPEQWKELIIEPVYKVAAKLMAAVAETVALCQLCTKFYPTSCVNVNFICRGNWILVWISITDQLLIIYFAFVKYFRRNGFRVRQCVGRFRT
jgi:hypothetical protein